MTATVLSFHRFSTWAYWTPMVLCLAAGLFLGWPGRSAMGGSSSRGKPDETSSSAGAGVGPVEPVRSR
jgi:hypothetical protein